MVCTWVSFRRSPVAPLRESRSLPARSMRFSTPCTVCSVLWNSKNANLMRINCTGTQKMETNYQKPMIWVAKMYTSLQPEILRVKTQWLLDDCSFIAVLPTDLQTQHQVSASQQVKISRKELHNQLCLASICQGLNTVFTWAGMHGAKDSRPPSSLWHPQASSRRHSCYHSRHASPHTSALHPHSLAPLPTSREWSRCKSPAWKPAFKNNQIEFKTNHWA